MKTRVIVVGSSLAATVIVTLAVLGTNGVSGSMSARLARSTTSATASLDRGPAGIVSTKYDLAAHQTLSRVILLIRENYVDPNRIQPYEMFLAGLGQIEKTMPEVLIDDSKAPERIRVAVGSQEQFFDLGGLDKLWEMTMALRDVFQFLQRHIDDPDRRRDVEYAAINGMLSTLDPHSILLKPENFDEVRLSTKGEFGGLGIVISIRDGSLTIISPIEGTPAARAGLRAQDTIVKIGEESTVNMTLEEAVHRLRGAPGSKAHIWILRKNWTEPKRFELTRAIIKIESVTSKLLEKGIGYVRIKSFQNNTYDDLHSHLEKLRRKNRGELKGLVLDLRNNPGGLLDQAILVSDRFIDRGPIVITVGEGNRTRDVKRAHFSGTEPDYPIATLVNGGSASASEIVSGAMKNHNRAIVIGKRTFGKGSVQVLYDFKDKSALKLTIAQYLTPGDVSIQSIGIVPDIEIVPATISKDGIHLFAKGQSPREEDLEKHLQGQRTQQDDETAFEQVYHYVTADDKDDTKQESATPSRQDEFKYDYEIRLAEEILAHSQGPDRDLVLRQAKPLLERWKLDEEKKIAKALSDLGADWSEGPRPRETRLDVSLVALNHNGQRGPIPAGKTATLRATVTNRGQEPLFQVYGTTQSENPLLKNREFVFGKLQPGETKSWDVAVKLPQDLYARADRIALKLGDQHGVTKGLETSTLVAVNAQTSPHFSYTAWIDDKKGGNGDGVLQVGEAVALRVLVKNVGSGAASDTMVAVKNLSGAAVFLDRGRDSLGALKNGERQTSELRFSLKKEKKTVDLRLSIWDATLGGAVSDKLALPVEAPRKATVASKRIRTRRGGQLPIYSGASTASRVIAHAKPGQQFRSDASYGGTWWRLELADGRYGFVQAAEVVALKGPGKRTQRGAYRMVRGESAPRMTVDYGDLIGASATKRLRGRIENAGSIRDMFVFVNDKKVLYRSLDTVALKNGKFDMPFDFSIPLDVGLNTVAVVVRENDDLTARTLVGLYRKEGQTVGQASKSMAGGRRRVERPIVP